MAPAGQPWVLVVENDDSVRELAGQILRIAGYRVRCEADGESALDALVREDGPCGCVVLDVNLPGMDGGEVLSRVRSFDPAIPVLMMSGTLSAELRDRYAEDPPNDFVQKPFGMADLTGRVRALAGEPASARAK